MPKIGNTGDNEVYQVAGSNFTFQGARLTHLGATEYTLVTIAVDVTGSTAPFAKELRDMLVAAVESCKKSPRSDNLLVRAVTFSTTFRDGINELHGFKLLRDINPQTDYPQFMPDGMTPLYDAVYSAVEAMVEYGGELMKNDFPANGIVLIITDGLNNQSLTTPRMIKEQIEKVRREEKLESLVTVLVGVNAQQFRPELDKFRIDADLTHYIDMGDVTPGKLARLGGFISRSVSSQSQALGTGGPSQQIKATI